jgi:hypothetical protein
MYIWELLFSTSFVVLSFSMWKRNFYCWWCSLWLPSRASIEPKRSGSSSDLITRKDKELSIHQSAKQSFLRPIHEKNKSIISPKTNSQGCDNKTHSKSANEVNETQIQIQKDRNMYENLLLMIRNKTKINSDFFYEDDCWISYIRKKKSNNHLYR